MLKLSKRHRKVDLAVTHSELHSAINVEKVLRSLNFETIAYQLCKDKIASANVIQFSKTATSEWYDSLQTPYTGKNNT